MNVSKREIAETVAESTGLGKNAVLHVIDDLFLAIGDEIAKGNKVSFTGFLTFNFGKRSAVRKGTPVRNPQTGEMTPSAGKPAMLRLAVRPGKKLKDRVPGPTTKVGKGLLGS